MEARVLLSLAVLLLAAAYLLLETEATAGPLFSAFGKHDPSGWRAYTWEHRKSWLTSFVEYLGELIRNTFPLAAIAAFIVTAALLGALCFLTCVPYNGAQGPSKQRLC